jgi:hypothetical protein
MDTRVTSKAVISDFDRPTVSVIVGWVAWPAAWGGADAGACPWRGVTQNSAAPQRRTTRKRRNGLFT